MEPVRVGVLEHFLEGFVKDTKGEWITAFETGVGRTVDQVRSGVWGERRLGVINVAKMKRFIIDVQKRRQ